MKLLVTGGRNFNNWELIEDALNLLHHRYRFTHLIQGCASGADNHSRIWAERNSVQIVSCPANWNRHGNAAGPRRNQAMVDLNPDLCFAFPGEKGTADMTRRCEQAGIPVLTLNTYMKFEFPAAEPKEEEILL